MRAFVLVCLTVWAVSSSVQAQFQLEVIDVQESEDLRLYYVPLWGEYADDATHAYYNSLSFQKELMNWEPWDKPNVLLKDFSDYGNASARASPNNGIFLEVSPISRSFETFPSGERIFSLMNHELFHVASMDVWNDRDAFWRKAFLGKPKAEGDHPITILYSYLATPRISVPSWYLEGSAVFMETWMGSGLGRAQAGYDEMVFRSKVRDGSKLYDPLGLVAEGTKTDFQAGINSYLYGGRFMSYLALTYSPEKVLEWLRRSDDSKAYYSAQFEYVFGKKLGAAWNDWLAWEKVFQTANLEKVRLETITPSKPLSTRTLGSVSKLFFNPNSNSLVGGFLYPGVVAHIGEISLSDGQTRHINDIKGPMLYRVTSPAFDPTSNTLWYTTDNRAYRDIMELDLETGKARRLQKDARIGDLAFNSRDGSLWGIRHDNGLVTIVRMERPFDTWKQVYTFPYGTTAFDIDISHNGEMLAATIGKKSGQHRLQVFRLDDIANKVIDPIAEFEPPLGYIPEGAAFSLDDRYVYGSSYFTGISNIFRLEIANNDFQVVSNTETGLFRPIPMADGSLVVLEFTGDGFAPASINPVPLDSVSQTEFLGNRIAREHPIVREWSVVGTMTDTKEAIDTDAIEAEDYSPIKEIGLGSAYPIIEGFGGGVALGYHFNLEDPLQLGELDVTISYSLSGDATGGEKLHADIQYTSTNWYARFWHNDADFYDLFGPTKRARRGRAILAGYKKNLIFDLPEKLTASIDLGYFSGLDTLPDNQNVAFALDEILSGQLALEYTNTQTAIGSVSHEKGWRGGVAFAADYTPGDVTKKVLAGVDFGFALPIKNSSVWFYNTAGLARGDASNPLSQFYFGGFKNNYVDDGEIRRYRSFHTFPGFEIDKINARNFAKSIAEWNLPPIRFDSAGVPSAYLGFSRVAVFGGALYADTLTDSEVAYTIGAQTDFRFTLGHRLPMTFSVGYASGFRGGNRSDEVMVSLKIM